MGGISSTESSGGKNFEGLEVREKVSVEDFDLIKFIGKGTFGKVYLVREKASDKLFAMKVLKKSQVVDSGQVEHTKAERDILARSTHPFLIALRYAFQSKNKLYLIMEYLDGGELFTHLRKYRSLPEEWLRFYGAEIISAFSYLHSKGIAYRDLKPENVIMEGSGHIKLTDFGLAKELGEGTETLCGTPAYSAPEMLKGKIYGLEVDLWAFGILLYELATGTTPFYHKNRVFMCKKIIHESPNFPEHFSSELKDLLEGLLRKDQTERYSLIQVKQHPFFEGISWEDVEKKKLKPPIVPDNPGGTSQLEQEDESSFPNYSPSPGCDSDKFSGFSFEGCSPDSEI